MNIFRQFHDHKKITLVSPSSPATEEEVTTAIAFCKSYGYEAELAPNCQASYFDLAGTDKQRLDDLHFAFESDSSAIMAIRGGYGSSRLLPHLDFDLIKSNPKLLFGFSDTTALQLAIFAKTVLKSISGLMAGRDTKNGTFPPLLKRSLGSLMQSGSLPSINNLEVIRPGKAEGTIIGGCLSLITSLIGTPYLPDFEGKILYIEEVGEHTYKLDRMMRQLQQAGLLSKLKGLLLGSFHKCDPRNDEEFPLDILFLEWAEMINGPVLAKLPYGHTPDRLLMPIGSHTYIDSQSGEQVSIIL